MNENLIPSYNLNSNFIPYQNQPQNPQFSNYNDNLEKINSIMINEELEKKKFAPMQENNNPDINNYIPQKSDIVENRKINIDGSEELFCKCCHGGNEEGTDWISPCLCSGSLKYVHRHCLDQWRVYSHRPDSFYQCDICQSKYKFEEIKDSTKNLQTLWTYLKYFILCGSDIAILFIVWQILVWICCLIVIFCDWYRTRDLLFPSWFPFIFVDYLFGNCLFFFLLGFFSTFFGICAGCLIICGFATNKNQSVTMESYSYHHHDTTFDSFLFYYLRWSLVFQPNTYYYHPPVCFCVCDSNDCRNCGNCGPADCNCGNCNINDCKLGDLNCKGGGDAGAAVLIVILVIVLIVVAIFIIIGVFVGLCIALFFVYSVLNRRLILIKKRDDVIKYRIANLN